MRRILLLSDTHGYLDEGIISHVREADEVWHAGDWGGGAKVFERLNEESKILRGVWGNIDGATIRALAQEWSTWECEGVRILMTHIAGKPGKYNREVKERLRQVRPNVLICGHSHILLVQRDQTYGHLHINPGAAGLEGFHTMRTMIRMELSEGKVSKMDAIELGPRTKRVE